MKIILLSLIAALSAIAQTPTTKPPDIPASRQEAISQVMLGLQQAQLELQSVQLSAQSAVAKSQKKVTDEQAKYEALQAELRKEFKVADACQLTLEKAWRCPAPDAAPAPVAPAPAPAPKAK